MRSAEETIDCEAEAVAIPELVDGRWHHITVGPAARRNSDAPISSLHSFITTLIISDAKPAPLSFS